MSACTFFGHRDTPKEIEPILRSALIDMVTNKNVNLFYVGNHGNFDHMVRKQLKEIKQEYPHIDYAVVLAYMPNQKSTSDCKDTPDCIYPEEMENTLSKYAIIKRNKWMIDHSDYVITYVKYTVGGAARFRGLAEKKGKIVVNLENTE